MWRPPSPKVNNAVRLFLAVWLAAAAFLAPADLRSGDDLQSLIDDEKRAYDEWLDDIDDPPAACFPGTRDMALVYSPAFRDSGADLLCESPNLPELLELSGGDAMDVATTLNLGLPRVRQAIGESCLLRPGDRVIAVGRGWQVERELRDFVVRREAPACPDDAPLGLWMTFDQPLPGDPLFVTTDPDVMPLDNLFAPAGEFAVASASAELMARFRGLVQFPEDYRVTLVELGGPDIDAVVLFERRTLSISDDGLPAMIAAVVSPGDAQVLWTERVDARRGTGRFAFEGVLDMDGDGAREIVLSGVHQTCPYTVIFRRSEGGFEPLPLAVRTCRC